jgi:hypothetical protein
MYRLQLFCNIFGTRGEGGSSPARIENSLDRARFLSMFTPWEIEKILFVHDFVKDIYTGVFIQVACDLNMEHPKDRHVIMADTIYDLKVLGYDKDLCK